MLAALKWTRGYFFQRMTMATNLVEDIQKIEAEADALVAEAKSKAKQLVDQGASQEIAEAATQLEAEYSQKIEDAKDPIRARFGQETQAAEQEHAEALRTLESVDDAKREPQIEKVLARICGR